MTQGHVAKGEMVSKQNAKGVKVYNWKDKCNVFMLLSVPERSEEFEEMENKY